MKKVCFIIPNFFPIPATKGGAVETLVTNLINVNEKEHLIDFSCVCPYEEKAYEISKSYKYTTMHYIKLPENTAKLDFSDETVSDNFRIYMDEVYKVLANKSFDYMVIEGGNYLGYEYLIQKLPSQKFLLHMHGNVAGDERLLRNYKFFIAISNYVKNYLTSNKIISPNFVRVVENGIAIENFTKKVSEDEKDELKEKYNIKKTDCVLMFCGRTVPQKGIKELILAFKKMKHIDNCKLMIVGNSKFGNEILTDYDKELIEISKDVSDKIIFTGFIHNTNLYKIHSIADISIIPSMWEEPSGLVVMESMASGLPIITTLSGGIPELVTNKNAFVLERDENLIQNMADKLDYLYENPNVRAEMGKESKKHSVKYSKENFYKNFVNLMDEVDV